ncbi:uncharacterized protein LOC134766075 [Penaeus indicus]|uniref:uncharacterized protein LOC134766075 n=1 Tax=Penaeus indicus TaxID=29960 RepID=UPI00300C1D9E
MFILDVYLNISYSSSRGGISMVVEKGPTTISYLLIREARDEDSGVYTCVPSNHNATSVSLHVLNGEHPAAIHTNSSVSSSAGGQGAVLVTTTLLRLLAHLWFSIT